MFDANPFWPFPPLLPGVPPPPPLGSAPLPAPPPLAARMAPLSMVIIGDSRNRAPPEPPPPPLRASFVLLLSPHPPKPPPPLTRSLPVAPIWREVFAVSWRAPPPPPPIPHATKGSELVTGPKPFPPAEPACSRVESVASLYVRPRSPPLTVLVLLSASAASDPKSPKLPPPPPESTTSATLPPFPPSPGPVVNPPGPAAWKLALPWMVPSTWMVAAAAMTRGLGPVTVSTPPEETSRLRTASTAMVDGGPPSLPGIDSVPYTQPEGRTTGTPPTPN